MRKLTINSKEILAFEVPDDACDFDLPEQDFGNLLQYRALTLANKFAWSSVMLPPEGQYTLLGRGYSLSDEQCRELVESHSVKYIDGNTLNGWKDYEFDENEKIPELYDVMFLPFQTAKESFASFLKSNGIDDKDLLILKIK